ncbi:hypothetical protein DMC47_14985 [Nostoc sp. 3335mG]|nr:hypothetical protein DMC47_14985 [Nostoc sp. 3335mG]
MPTGSSRRTFRPSLMFVTLSGLMLVLWLAGGASRGNVPGQVIVRVAALLALVIAIVFGQRAVTATARPMWIFLGTAITLLTIQLLPLSPDIWNGLPGRQFIGNMPGGDAAGGWRPLSLVPGGTVNALVSLLVPLAVLALATSLSAAERAYLPSLILMFAAGAVMLGLLQFSGVGINNPLINDTPGAVSGTFANRNHFALFLALGILVIPVWVFQDGARLQWRGPTGLSLLLLFMLTILAAGSRAGMAVGSLAIIISGMIAWRELHWRMRRAPRWMLPAAFAAVTVLLAAFALFSVAADRAVSIQRGLSVDVEQDIRSRALPTVWKITRATFPVGSGAGSFDSMFRAYEPDALLKPTYFNHAHNDFIELVLELGLPGLLLLLAVFAWWARASVDVWRNSSRRRLMLPRLGSAMLLLIMVASIFDYPARTPFMMAMTMLAGVWLSSRFDENRTPALPA